MSDEDGKVLERAAEDEDPEELGGGGGGDELGPGGRPHAVCFVSHRAFTTIAARLVCSIRSKLTCVLHRRGGQA
jgi:hypothetical protein